MTFEPIAIVGRACLLPGAGSPAELWEAVLAGRDLTSECDPDRWRMPRAEALRSPGPGALEGAWHDRGGYVRGFESAFDPTGFGLSVEAVRELDPLAQWVLHVARQALDDAGVAPGAARAGAVLGNLSLPSEGLTAWAESAFLAAQDLGPLADRAAAIAGVPAVPPAQRFMSGLPAHLLAEALSLDAGAFALDAACASSLYAIKLACDKLHDGQADVMLAGAVNRADDLFIHAGFTALQALSPSGRSRPFHRDADGLLPAEGCAFVVLKRLSRAEADGDRVLGVIRGVGLSNDGRGSGLLAPSAEGQERAIREAYRQAGWEPGDVSLVECHATGTAVGDATELESLGRVFAGRRDVPIGSAKSNIGHAITVAGLAGVLKVLGAFESGVMPPGRPVDQPTPALDHSPFRLLAAPEPWPTQGPRRAAVSAFGFGGNNAHLLLEEYRPGQAPHVTSRAAEGPIAIVAVGASVGSADSRAAFARVLFGDGAVAARAESIALPLKGLRFPPSDLKQTLPQQLLVLAAAHEALEALAPLPRERTGVFIGMGCDAEIARHGTRWRLGAWRDAWAAAGVALPDAWLQSARAGTSKPLEAACVVGSLPNIVTNRLNAQFDLAGPSCSVSAEELSGLRALEVAERALRAGELDAAVVGAVDLACDTAHAAAAEAVLPPGRRSPGDAAVVLVLKRLDDARRDGDRVMAVLPGQGQDGDRFDEAEALEMGLDGLGDRFGHAHAASGLVHVAAAALALAHRATPALAGRPAQPWLSGPEGRSATVRVAGLGGATATVRLLGADLAPQPAPVMPFLTVYAGADRAALATAIADHSPGEDGPARLVIIAESADELARKREGALAFLRGEVRLGEGVYFRERPLEGELAFVFPGGASAYAGMGRQLLLARPDLIDRVAERAPGTTRLAGWAYAPDAAPASPLDKLWGASMLCQAHAALTREVLGLKPQAAIGMSSGETNALFALGAWSDMDALVHDFDAAGGFTHWLGGDFAALTERGLAPAWANWRLLAERDAVEAALAAEPSVRLIIVNAPGDLVIAGPPEACDRVVAALGADRARKLDYDVLAHCPELAPFAEAWRRVHTRETRPVPGVRFYAHATADAYTPTAEAAAEMLTRQAFTTIDFPAVIEKAYADGVRVFVEHGPQGGCTGWIRRILGDRPHLAVALDLASEPGVRQLAQAIAPLLAAGVSVDHRALFPLPDEPDGAPRLSFPAHPLPVAFPPVPAPTQKEAQLMSMAPWLPSVLDESPAVQPPRTAMPVQPPQAPLPGHGPAPVGSPAAAGLAAAVQLTQAHQAHLAHMAQAQARFIEVSRHALAAALGQTAVGPVAPIVPILDPAPEPMAVSAAPAPAAPPAEPVAVRPEATRVVPVEALPAPTPPPPPAPRTVEGIWHAPPPRAPQGPAFGREDLEVLASGSISSVFGPLFERQDGYARQVRMPMPPLLLADRVLGIQGEAGSMGLGTIWTETDVTWDSWYLHEGRMPPGIMIESGQADLLLISYLGADFLNQGDRVYRLLGCELVYHGGLPKAGETLRFEIHVDGHARQGDIRLFFFHYDCRVDGELRLSVRNGQAGFFTDAELAASGGVLWDPTEETPDPAARLDGPAVPLERRGYSREQVRAFAAGRLVDCFGPAYALAETHTQSPRIQDGQMCLLGDVVDLDPTGGPWGRGYMRIETDVSPDDWFFAGHFKNDPCMPGTLMVEGCLQAMAFYMAAMGYTLDKDGWRFEPVTGEPYTMRCRGQVTPSSKRVTYEIFVSEVHDGPVPTLYADLLGCVDGVKAFHCRRMGLGLVPDWPIARMPELLAEHTEPKPVATIGEHRFDYASLLACAWGKPSAAFGPAYAIFDGVRRCPRLPGPPYHFISRVTRVEGAFGVAQAGATAEMEYDVPADAWYFDDNGCRRMPYAVLLEAALQPCGWLATYSGVPLRADEDLFFRNLDGTGTLYDDLAPDGDTLHTTTTLKSVSQAGGMTLVAFEVACFLGDRLIYDMTTMFGFFPAKALQSQIGLPPTPDERAAVEAPSDFAVDLTTRPARYFTGTPRMPAGRLLMLDRVTGYWPTGGKAGLGRMRAEKDVDPDEWFFKAHFYQDPVQPGSLGIEAMIQLLQFAMLERGMGEGLADARFETLMHERPLSWKYRGQVVPRNRTIVTELEITEVGTDARGPYAIADAWLWVDGLRIYAASNLGMRLVASGDDPRGPLERTVTLDPARDTWLNDHSPTYAVPALPLMSTVELLAEAARARRPGAVVTGVQDLRLQGWVDLPAPRQLRTAVTAEDESGLSIGLALAGAEGTRFDPVAQGRVLMGAAYGEPPAPWATCADGTPQPDPYADGSLFHGPAFQVLRSLSRGAAGSSAILDAGGSGVPVGHLHPALLDGVTHALPNDAFETWAGPAAADQIAFPSRLVDLALFGQTPTSGPVCAEVRFAGLGDDGQSPLVHAQLIAGDRVWATLTLEMRLFPKGPLGRGARLDRRAFLKDRAFVNGLGLSDTDPDTGVTRLTLAAIAQSNWFPGFLGTLYDAPADRLAESAVLKDHAAAHFGEHPGRLGLALDGDAAVAWRPEAPLNRLPMRLERAPGALTAHPAGPERLDLEPVRGYWRRTLGRPAPPVEDLFFGLAERFVSGVHLEDPRAYQALQGRSVLYLANHQVGIESPLFSILVSALGGVPTATLAKAEHRESWLGQLLTLAFAYPGLVDPELILFFDRQDQGSLLDILGTVRERLSASPRSLLVHVDGTRSTSCREPVRTLSAAFLDLAVERAMPIVPVRFVGGLPVEPVETRLEFPVGYGRQAIRLGRPIAPDDLAARPLAERKALVLDRLAALAPADEAPAPADDAFAADVARRLAAGAPGEVEAVLRAVLEPNAQPGTPLYEVLGRSAAGPSAWSDPTLAPWLDQVWRYLNRFSAV